MGCKTVAARFHIPKADFVFRIGRIDSVIICHDTARMTGYFTKQSIHMRDMLFDSVLAQLLQVGFRIGCYHLNGLADTFKIVVQILLAVFAKKLQGLLGAGLTDTYHIPDAERHGNACG